MRLLPTLLVLILIAGSREAPAQFRVLESEDLQLVYFDLASDFVVEHAARSHTNSLAVYRDLLGYSPSEPVTVMLHDQSDYGNAGADVIPRNRIVMAMAPLSYSYETAPANERINSTLHHELIHIASNDGSAGADRVFRGLFRGKVEVDQSDPETILYSYLTAPRRYAPRWYQEGIAVFMETWLSGGLGRSLGGYDEMVFRTAVLEDRRFYGVVGLESEGTAVDFQVGVNSYLYGTRFMSYLAVVYGPEKVLDWFMRDDDSKAHFSTQFRHVFGMSLASAWEEWIEYERAFQEDNLARIRENPVSEYRVLAAQPLGSMSRPFIDPATGDLIAAVNYPGSLSHLARIDLESGQTERLTDVRGPMLYTVASVAFDDEARRVFYTTDNSRRRDLVSYDLETGNKSLLLQDARIGDLAYNPVDRSLWGVRHFLGLSSLVRIPPPYTDWDHVHTFDYGTDLYDPDISPDGRHMTGALVRINGEQVLTRLRLDDLLEGTFEPESLFNFGTSNPESFVHSEDGASLYGSSYYSGVSNLFRIDLDTGRATVLTNAETGFFRPLPIGDGRLLAFVFTADGFQPVELDDRPASDVSSIEFLGQRVVDKHPVVTEWMAPPPSRIDLDDEQFVDRPYNSLRELQLESVVPIVRGYRGLASLGLRFDISDPIFSHDIQTTVTWSPDPHIPDDERLHAGLSYRHRSWTLAASHNGDNFYDLFGPRMSGRKGQSVRLTYGDVFAYQGPKKNLSYEIGGAGHFNLRSLPDHQNVAAIYTRLFSAHASLDYQSVRSSLGAVDVESGLKASVSTSANIVNEAVHPRISAGLHRGIILPIPHLSLWIRGMGGISAGRRDNPFANFYFGGFRNNWVDHRAEQRYRDQLAFPGLEIDEIGGTSFARAQTELLLPPARFRRAGGGSFYLKWLRPSVFATGLMTNIDDSSLRMRAANVGAQIDARIMLFSYLRTTLSAGWAQGWIEDGRTSDEFMVSLKIL